MYLAPIEDLLILTYSRKCITVNTTNQGVWILIPICRLNIFKGAARPEVDSHSVFDNIGVDGLVHLNMVGVMACVQCAHYLEMPGLVVLVRVTGFIGAGCG